MLFHICLFKRSFFDANIGIGGGAMKESLVEIDPMEFSGAFG
jgi:hypothetical protein